MQPETAEWIEIAEGDFLTATREVAADVPNFNATCFHAQQCIEKYLKAVLVERNVAFPRTHQLGFLADLLPELSADLELIRNEIARLSPYAIDVRYPRSGVDADEARQAMDDCASARSHLRGFARAGAVITRRS